MRIYRIVYVFSLAIAAIFYALYPHWLSWYLVVLILLLLLFDFAFSIPGMATTSISLAAPKTLEQTGEGAIELVTLRKRRFPVGWVRVRLNITSDSRTTRRRILCSPEIGSRFKVAIDTSHCGVSTHIIKNTRATSIFGLFAMSRSANLAARTLILPKPLKPPRIISLPRGVILYPKPGGGFSEESDLRPYRMGDPIRIIHWKLSAKHDSLIIREPLAPPNLSRLVQVSEWHGAEERDIILGRLRWISDYLLKWELSFYVRIGSGDTVAEIESNDDMLAFMTRVLDSTVGMQRDSTSLPTSFSWVFRIDAKEDDTD
ncbi:MAG: DUF58 domain-containing protein [Oscillospiraceae bacterium]|nr:DUF58 domain-containing protein [Oscillospiraceae bacterium]